VRPTVLRRGRETSWRSLASCLSDHGAEWGGWSGMSLRMLWVSILIESLGDSLDRPFDSSLVFCKDLVVDDELLECGGFYRA